MGVQLLDKTRKINKLLHNNSSSKVVFNDICEVLTEILDSNVLVISKKGKVLGGSKCEGVPYITELIEREIGKHVDDMLNERLLSILSTKENVNLQTLGFSLVFSIFSTYPHCSSLQTSLFPFSSIYAPHLGHFFVDGFCHDINSHSGLSSHP